MSAPVPTGERAITILLVDDDALVLRALRRSLAGEGHRILATSEPTEVVDLCTRERVDVLVTDIDMPGLSGVDLVALMKREHPSVVRILLTGAATLDSAIKAINEGEVFRYLTKPWENAELRATLRDAAARAREVERASADATRAERRAQLMAAAEEAFPGLTHVERADGHYTLDLHCVARGLAHFESDALWAIWQHRRDPE